MEETEGLLEAFEGGKKLAIVKDFYSEDYTVPKTSVKIFDVDSKKVVSDWLIDAEMSAFYGKKTYWLNERQTIYVTDGTYFNHAWLYDFSDVDHVKKIDALDTIMENSESKIIYDRVAACPLDEATVLIAGVYVGDYGSEKDNIYSLRWRKNTEPYEEAEIHLAKAYKELNFENLSAGKNGYVIATAEKQDIVDERHVWCVNVDEKKVDHYVVPKQEGKAGKLIIGDHSPIFAFMDEGNCLKVYNAKDCKELFSIAIPTEEIDNLAFVFRISMSF